MVYDRARDRVLVFGGRGAGVDLNDTWAFHVGSRTWEQLATGTAARPSPRFSVVAGIDDLHGRLLVATGQGGGGFFNDVWRFDLVTNTWSEVSPGGARPNVRYGSGGGTYDPGRFTRGGSDLYVTHGFTDQGRFDDSWRFDDASGAWSDRTPFGSLPLRRCLHGSAVVSPAQLVIFGGCASGFGPCPLDDTWRFDDASGAWIDLTQPIRPAARFFPSLARMGDGRDLLLFGGRGTANFNDAWRLDSMTGQWTPLSPIGTPPSGRQSASLAWIDTPDRSLTGGGCGFALVFGGFDGAGEKNDLWMLAPASPPLAPSIRADRFGTELRLTWEHRAENLAYEVWRSQDPRFASTGTGLALASGAVTINGSGASFVDTDPAPAGTILYYQVRVAACQF